MQSLKHSELRGILALALVIVVVAGLFAVASGKLETWFGITIGGGPRLYDKIVFVSARTGSNEIYAANPDGSDLKRLTTGAHVTGAPSVSPNGARVVFAGKAGKESQIFVVRSGGGNAQKLTSVTGAKRLPQFSPDGRQLAFISGGTVYVGDQNAAGLRPVLPTEQETRVAMVRREQMPAYKEFVWTPNGKGIAGVTQNAQGDDEVVILPKLEGKPIRLTLPDGIRIQGMAYSGEDSFLAISVSGVQSSSVALLDSDSRELRVIASLDGPVFGAPAVSPDGTRVAVPYSSRSGRNNRGILQINTQTGESETVVKGSFEKLCYSPDGEMLAALEVNVGIKLIDCATGRVTAPVRDHTVSCLTWSPATPR